MGCGITLVCVLVVGLELPLRLCNMYLLVGLYLMLIVFDGFLIVDFSGWIACVLWFLV